MDAADLELLKASTDKYVVIHIEDGEVIVAAVHFVSDEDQDVIYDVISSPKFLLDEEINLLNICEIKLKRISFSGYKSNN